MFVTRTKNAAQMSRRTAVWAVAILAGLLAASPLSASDPWLTNYEQAMSVAQQTGRPVLTVFTGSDWCPHCKTLENNVLHTEAFSVWAEENVVLLMLDLPQAGISQAVRSERSQVCIKYGVRTFPSVLLIGTEGQRLAGQSGYTGQSAATWIGQMAVHLPALKVAPADTDTVCETLDEAVASARGRKRPILLVVSRAGDTAARSQSASLMNDPEFEAFAHDNFVVATVGPSAQSGSQTERSMENLLGGAELPTDAVELIVTDDGQTPLFSQSGSQPSIRIINGLKRFLAARQLARQAETARR